MAKTCRPYLPEQDLLLPPSLRDWLPENHPAYFVSEVIDQLELSAIESHQAIRFSSQALPGASGGSTRLWLSPCAVAEAK